jgi:serine/threonine-protein kinase HipA
MDDMAERITLEVHVDGRWQVAATVEPGPGHRDASTFDYDMQYCWQHDPEMIGSVIGNTALSVRLPLSLEWQKLSHWPAFLLDLLPQGHARQRLAKALNLNPDSSACELPLLLRAGGGPIGNIRVREAWEAEQVRLANVTPRGTTLDDVFNLNERFLEMANDFVAVASGSSGVQGAWPKMLLTKATDGLWYPDPVVADDHAVEHAIIKWIGDKHTSTSQILAAEAPYLELARAFGLRCAAPLRYCGNVLLMPRFDRRVESGKVIRIGQESLVSATGVAAFGHIDSHETYLEVIKAVCDDPAAEVTEYVLRDVLNLAMGNPDNHGRNTALQKDTDGTIRLTPLFDFCPMRLDPTGVARSTSWACMKAFGKPSRDLAPDWSEVCEVAAAGVMPAADLKVALASKSEILRRLPEMARDMGVDGEVIQRAMARCKEMADAIGTLRYEAGHGPH